MTMFESPPPKARTTVKDLLPVGAWVATKTGAGQVTEASGNRATIAGVFRREVQASMYRERAVEWDYVIHVETTKRARTFEHVTESTAHTIMGMERAQADADLAATERRQAANRERSRLAEQRTRLLREIGRRLDVADADTLERMERALSGVSPIVEALCSKS